MQPRKCVETIYRLPHWGKEIVHPSGKLGDMVHHRHRHGFQNFAESSAGDCGGCYPDRRGYVDRQGRRLKIEYGTKEPFGFGYMGRGLASLGCALLY